MLQLLEFQEKMDRVVPVIVGAATPVNYAETIVEVQNFVKWTITDPKGVRHYLELALEERLAALDFYRDFGKANGLEFFCLFGGARTWGPKQLEEFGDIDRRFTEKVRTIFHHNLWHHCGRNLPQAMEMLAGIDGVHAIQYDMPYYNMDVTWFEWFQQNAKLFAGRKCACNAPTTQMAAYATPQEIDDVVKDFCRATAPYTTAIVMPGCEVDSYAPTRNVRAMINAARTHGRYPIATD
jgi:uroporphyrinogen-III decarboxylase